MNPLAEHDQYRRIVMHFRESLSALASLREEMREYDDFYLAKHWNKERPSWRPDPVVNYVSYIVDQKAPQLTNQRPSGLILPTAQDDEEAAKIFTQVTDVVAERVDLDDKVDQVVRTGLLFGTGWFKVYWDNSIQGGSEAKGNIFVGDVAVSVPDPSNIFTDPNATCVEEQRYMIYAVPKSISWIEKKYDVKVDPDQAFETELFDRPSNNSRKDSVMFYEYWYKDKDSINVIYAAGGKILKEIKEVYKHGRFPFIPFVAKKNRKSIWGIGEPKNIIANQKLLNKLMELPTTNALLNSNPITLIDPKSGLNPKQWQNKPGIVAFANNAKEAVHIVEPPQLSNDLYKLTDLLQTFIERIGGVYDSMTGETPNGVTAATAIQLLQEQGSLPIKGIARNLYQSIKDVYELMIELIKENYTETRYIRIIDEDGTFEFKEFNAMQYAEVDFDVKVSAGASTPTSKAYIAQLGSELFDKGILLPSEYVEMQEGLPNKDRIVARLREQEQRPPAPTTPPVQVPPMGPPMGPPPIPMEQPPMMPPSPPINLDMIMQQAPPEIQQEVQLMLEQGMNEEQIIQMLLGPQM